MDAVFSDTCSEVSQSCVWKELCAQWPCMGLRVSDSISRT